MTERKFPEETGAPPEDVLWFLNRDVALLDSESAYWRLRGIQAVTGQGRYEAVSRLKGMLEDDAPVIWDDLVTEIRQCALVGLQRLHWAARLPLELGPVLVRRPWPLTDLRKAYEEAMAELTAAERRDALARANEYLMQRVQPDPAQADDLRAYRVLQQLDRVAYERQTPDPDTTLTPLQEIIYAEQVALPRPRPCLRVMFLERPEKTIGWIYRNPSNGLWAHDFSEHPAAAEGSEALSRILTLGRSGIPRVVHDEAGRPVRSPDGSFMLDGELSPDSDDVVECLRSIAAFMQREFATELLLPDEESIRDRANRGGGTQMPERVQSHRSTRPSGEILERALLALEGLSVGDAFGEMFLRNPGAAPLRLHRREAFPPPWPWTDDTQMAAAIVELLAEHGRVDQDELARRFAQRYEPHRGYGAAAHELLRELRRGGRWDTANRGLFGGQGSLGNGSAMRVAPLGAFFAGDLDRVAEQAALSAEITHAHPEGVAGAVAVAVAAALAWTSRGVALEPGAFLRAVAERLPVSATRDGVVEAQRLDPSLGAPEAGRILGNGSRITAPDTVPFCLWVVARHADGYTDALWSAASALGDIDTTCAIVGGVLALRVGLAGIPRDWREAREPLPAGLRPDEAG